MLQADGEVHSIQAVILGGCLLGQKRDSSPACLGGGGTGAAVAMGSTVVCVAVGSEQDCGTQDGGRGGDRPRPPPSSTFRGCPD
jgi:hypothetical protein